MSPHSHLRALTVSLCTVVGTACGQSSEDNPPGREHPAGMAVDFSSEGADAARDAACRQDFDSPTRIGAGADPMSASNLWSVTAYLVLLPATGEGHVTLSVDAPHFDWLLYTQAGVTVEAMGGPRIELGGPLASCPGQQRVEYGAHHHEATSWPLRLVGEPGSRVEFYAALSPTEHSDLEHAGHAGHDLAGGVDAGATSEGHDH